MSSAPQNGIRSRSVHFLRIISNLLEDSPIFHCKKSNFWKLLKYNLHCLNSSLYPSSVAHDYISLCCYIRMSEKHLGPLTKVDIVISSTFSVHLVDKEAGGRFEQQTEDGHPCTEAKRITSSFCIIIQWVIDPKMDDVCQYRHGHSHQILKKKRQMVGLNGHILAFQC